MLAFAEIIEDVASYPIILYGGSAPKKSIGHLNCLLGYIQVVEAASGRI